jgi:16S rRNA (guanine(966)-N(2))-methyltransferase RsmD
MARRKKGIHLESWKTNRPEARPGKLRIVGGKYRGRQLACSGDPRTRPMKDNIREALFNLVGGYLQGKHVFDLFAGTGAIGLEALSRGALHATLIERHFPTAALIRQNIAELQVESGTTVIESDTFYQVRQLLNRPTQLPTAPWAVFCSPPYDLYVEREADLLQLLDGLIRAAPAGSLVVVESDERFDAGRLPYADAWKVRQYSPAQICILHVNRIANHR